MKRLFQKRELFVFSMVAMDTVLITVTYSIAYVLRSYVTLFGEVPVYLDAVNYRLIYPILLFSWLGFREYLIFNYRGDYYRDNISFSL